MEKGVVDAWREAWASRAMRVQLLTLSPLLFLTVYFLGAFLGWLERRPGVRLADPLLACFPPRDLAWPTFLLIYVAVAISLVVLARHPRHLVVGVQAYALMIGLRILAMYLSPLDAPLDTIPLRDPVAEHLATRGVVATRDLMFSGHVSTLCLLAIGVPSPRLRPVLVTCAVGVASCVLWQHVHYTIDVLVAPAFAFASYRIVRAAHRWA
jgi:hypothetical protein